MIDHDKALLDAFYNLYFRAPKKSEFSLIGGNVASIRRKFGTYEEWIKKNHIPLSTRSETYMVLEEGRNGDVVIFTGTPNEIAKEFDTTRWPVIRSYHERRYCYKQGKYKIVKKEVSRKDVHDEYNKIIKQEAKRKGVKV